MERLHAIVSGRVQGVNFRAYTQGEAQRLGLTGYVRNLPDSTVEVFAEGERSVLDQLLAWLHGGSPGSRVAEVRAQWQTARGEFSRFEVRI